jgi:hypothetical protein
MKRFFILTVVFGLLASSISASSVFAAPLGPSIALADVYVNNGLGNYNLNGENLQVASDEATCSAANPASITFLRWDVSSWASKAIESAQIVLTISINGTSGLAQFTLYKVADDTWDETKMTYNGPTTTYPDHTSPPTFNVSNDAIETYTLPSTGYLGNVVFQSANLKDYVAQQANLDGKASFALVMTSCPGDYAPAVEFLSKETGSPTVASAASNAPASPSAMTQPYMNVFEPTAVTLRFFRSADPAVNWPLIAGLAAVVIGGLTVTRKRAARR